MWEMSCCTLKEQQEQLYARFCCFYVDGDKIDKADEVNYWEMSLYSSVNSPCPSQMESNLDNVLKYEILF